MAEVEAVVVENNVADYVLEQAKVDDKAVPFDELMAELPRPVAASPIGQCDARPAPLAVT